jgi:hypothetical protein
MTATYPLSRDPERRLCDEVQPLSPAITVSVATRHCNQTVRRAVQSLIDQDHPELMVVVTSDGDGAVPRHALAELAEHPRVLVQELPESRGPYFAHDVVLRGAVSSLFAVQDADDVSLPDRFSRLFALLVRTGADATFGALRQCPVEGPSRVIRNRPWVDGPLQHRIDHFGLFRRSALLAVGGYYGGVRLGYDSFVTYALAVLGRCLAVEEVVYERRERPDSLTRAAETGFLSPARAQVRQALEARYRDLLEDPASAGTVRERFVPPEERRAIDDLAAALRGRIQERLSGRAE